MKATPKIQIDTMPRCYSPRVWSLVEIVNLTPHTLDIHDEQGNITTVPTSGQVARVSETRQYRPSVAGLPVVKIELGQVENLPAPEEGKIFIISLITLAAVKDRPDVYAPAPQYVTRQVRLLVASDSAQDSR